MKRTSRLSRARSQATRWIRTLMHPRAGVAAFGALLLAGAMGAHQVAHAGGDRAVGTLFGAGVGALAGQRFGGKEGAIVGGAIGAVVGNQLAHSSHRGYGSHRGSIIIGKPIWSGHRGHYYRDDRRYYDDRRRHRARERRLRRIERAERRAYRDGYRQGRRDARRHRHHRRWETRHRW